MYVLKDLNLIQSLRGNTFFPNMYTLFCFITYKLSVGLTERQQYAIQLRYPFFS